MGFDTVPQSAEEFNFSAAKTKAIMVVAIVFGAFVYVALNTVTAAVIPAGYETYSLSFGNSLANYQNSCVRHCRTRHTLLGDAGLVFLGVAVLAAGKLGIIGFYMATSRLLYSMAKEGVIAQRLRRSLRVRQANRVRKRTRPVVWQATYPLQNTRSLLLCS